ncbi:hypothetical protein [Vibrio mediterranei]|uniref:DUF3444 domain-containing protein n=1 Tax=Vibrio mediterranei TaxID=689 RepID=A0ABX5D5P6_9VIBR|nr:hypothetical protein [Vibrio mediterranei]PCD88368.1 hypothetical protein COR52_11155 [Vibrio mediterranei]PRQ64593.1 hypothetical protein COR51_26735 [Vibrio mediterranei]
MKLAKNEKMDNSAPQVRGEAKAPSGAAETTPVIIYGKRRIKDGMLGEFKLQYQAFSKSVYESNPDVKAIFAFPDKEEPLVYWHVIWVKSANAFANDWGRPTESEPLWATYKSTAEDPDTLIVYGGWDKDTLAETQNIPCVRYDFKKSMAGFIKADGGGEEGPALFGFTMRYVKPGQMKELGTSFQTVCNLWYEKIPGILMAAAFPDEKTPNLVHDLRLFANHSAFLAHVDKSDKELTEAMERWFENYDTSIPFSGQLYAASTKDDALHTSSIKSSSTPRAQLETFHFGKSGMLGQMPNMTRNDS